MRKIPNTKKLDASRVLMHCPTCDRTFYANFEKDVYVFCCENSAAFEDVAPFLSKQKPRSEKKAALLAAKKRLDVANNRRD